MEGDSNSVGRWSWQNLLIDCMQKVREGVKDSPERFPAVLRLPGSYSPPPKPHGTRLGLPPASCPLPAPIPHAPSQSAPGAAWLVPGGDPS